MGHLLHSLGEVSDRSVEANKRNSEKAGKGSFAYAWALDGGEEERERSVFALAR